MIYINQPLVRLLTVHYQSTVSMISFAQVWTVQWSNTIPSWNVWFLVRIYLTLFHFKNKHVPGGVSVVNLWLVLHLNPNQVLTPSSLVPVSSFLQSFSLFHLFICLTSHHTCTQLSLAHTLEHLYHHCPIFLSPTANVFENHNSDVVFIQHSKVSFNGLLLYSFCYSNIWPKVEINQLTFTCIQIFFLIFFYNCNQISFPILTPQQ